MDTSIDDSYRFLAACYFREQTKQLAAELVGIRESLDIEHVHQARVASRRLRAGMRVFGDCYPDRMLRRWQRAIKRITTELGTARDCDVHIEKLTRQLTGLKRRSASRAVARLLVDLERQRESCQPLVLREIDRIERGGALEEILDTTKGTLAEVGKITKKHARKGKSGRGKRRKGRGKTAYTCYVFDRLGEQIRDRFCDVKSYQDSLKSSKDIERHHAMRIAAKRLRYTMEIAAPVYRGRLDKSVEIVKRLQNVLGDIHDCDIWYDKLGKFKRYQRDRIVEAYGQTPAFNDLNKGFNYLRRRCKARRNKRFEDLVKLWKKLEKNGAWDDLLKTLDKKPRRKRAQNKGKLEKINLCHGGNRCHKCKRRNKCKKLRSAIDQGMVSISLLQIEPAKTAMPAKPENPLEPTNGQGVAQESVKKISTPKKHPGKENTEKKRIPHKRAPSKKTPSKKTLRKKTLDAN